jgi:hypothetical protein
MSSHSDNMDGLGGAPMTPNASVVTRPSSTSTSSRRVSSSATAFELAVDASAPADADSCDIMLAMDDDVVVVTLAGAWVVPFAGSVVAPAVFAASINLFVLP